ncbi:hypothetical protein CBR_g13050 [Chara braunii]|uniref:DUF659 domain-containing protein n=1 Tax=Chara braunii TaxID=69332 RepID=A0A388KTD7_CHABU|nr:hypothetical protein CBR_g13050 [Chara braunii]|eukprot:GBG73330.1 hypothetical protein CBR_g13050 [Chara braunii]
MVSEVHSAFQHIGATILSDGRKSRSGKPLVNFLAGGANGALLYATVARDGSVHDTTDVVYRRWWTIILSFPAKDVIGFCTDSASNYTAAARRFATDPDADIRSITWLPCSTHVCNLMLPDVGTRVGPARRARDHAARRRVGSHPVGAQASRPGAVDAAADPRWGDVFGKRVTELRPWLEYTAGAGSTPDVDADDDTSDDQWTDDDDAPISGDATAERVYFTYRGGPDGMAPHTSVITDDVPSGGQASAIGRVGDRRGRRPRGDEDVEEQEPLRGLRQTRRRWEVRSDSESEREDEEEEVPHQDRRYSPAHHRTTGPPQPERRSARLASAAERQRMHDSEDCEGARPVDMPDVERTPSGAGLLPRSPSELRTNDFDIGGSGGGLRDFSAPRQGGASPLELRTNDFDVRDRAETAEERDAQLDKEEEDRLQTLPGWEATSEGGSPGWLRAGRAAAVTAADHRIDAPTTRTSRGGGRRGDDGPCAHCHIGGSPPPVQGGVAGGWAAHRRVTDRLRADYDAGTGAFAGRLSPRTQAAGSSGEGGSGRPSLHIAGRMLGLSRSATRRSLVLPAAETSTDMQQGQHYTLGEEGLLMRPGTRRHGAITEVEAQLAAEIDAARQHWTRFRGSERRLLQRRPRTRTLAQSPSRSTVRSADTERSWPRKPQQHRRHTSAVHRAQVLGAVEGAREERRDDSPPGEASRVVLQGGARTAHLEEEGDVMPGPQ